MDKNNNIDLTEKARVFLVKLKPFFKKLFFIIRKFLTAMRCRIPKSPRGKKKLIRLKSAAHLIYFPLLFLYYEILLRILNGIGVFKHLIYPILFSFAVGSLFTCLTSCFSKKINRRITMIATVLVAVLYGVECMIKSTFQVYMTISSVTAGTNHVVTGYTDLLFSVILHGVLTIILYLIPFGLYWYFGKKKLPAWQYKPQILAPLAIFALVFFLLGNIFAGSGSTKLQYKDQYNFDTAVQTFGLMTGLRLELKYSGKSDSLTVETVEETTAAAEEIAAETAAPVETPTYGTNQMAIDFASLTSDNANILNMNAYCSSLTPSDQNAYTGIFEGKNLIMICAEAFSGKMISETLTPTLYRLTHNGMYFSDYYQPAWGGSTITGECSMLLGLVPTDGVQTSLDTIGKNLYFTMGNQLQRLGYYSTAMHGGEYDYYNRDQTHTNFGYTNWLGQNNGIEEICGAWPTDENLINDTIDVAITKQPFSLYYMTLSGHCKYKSDSKLVTWNLQTVLDATGGAYKDTTNYYLCYQLELEKALTTLIQKLEAAGIADDTVICLTADHYPYGLVQSSSWGNTEDYLADLYGYTANYPWERDANSLVIWSECMENEYATMGIEISSPTYSLDILPTLSNLFGLEYDSRLMVGRDVFSSAEPLVVWSNYSWTTTQGWYDSSSGTFFPKPNCTVEDQAAYVATINDTVKNKISFSKMVIANDYYGYLFGPDTVTGEPAVTVEDTAALRAAQQAAADQAAAESAAAEAAAADQAAAEAAAAEAAAAEAAAAEAAAAATQ